MKTIQKSVSVLLCLLTILSFWTLTANAADVLPVYRPAIVQFTVNVREAPSDTSQRIGGLTSGKEVYVLEQAINGGKVWYKINYNGTIGYILGSTALLIQEIGMVLSTTANVRITPQKGNLLLVYGEALRGESLYLIDKLEENGDTWYQVYFNGAKGYVLAEEVGVLKLPDQADTAKYRKNIELEVAVRNVPKDCKVMIEGKETAVSSGEEICVRRCMIGLLTSDHAVSIRILDGSGKPLCETEVVVPVNHSFFAKLIALFGYIFSFFRWSKQLVRVY